MEEGFPDLLMGLSKKTKQCNQRRLIYETRQVGENAIQCTQTLS